MTSPATRLREGHQPPSRRSAEPVEKRGYQPQEAVSPQALAKPPRGGSRVRPPAPPKK